MGEEVISTQDLNIREAINGGDMFGNTNSF